MDISPVLTQCIRRILKQHLLTGLLAGSLLISDEALSNPYANRFAVMPGATVTGLAGRNIVGQFDSMVPTLGNSNGFLYLDPQFSFHQGPDYSGALGLGGRWLSEQLGILGAYVFADYDHSPNSNHFWFVSPGLEFLGDCIDFSANAYIPVSSRQKFLQESEFLTFHGHDQLDLLFKTSESVGFGADAQLAYRLPIANSPKLYVGSYYSNPKESDRNNIWGGVVGIDVPVTDAIRVGVSEAYDNLDHNTVKLALNIDLGGRHTHKNYNKLNRQDRLASRMLDPIQRNLILVGGSSVTNQPIVQNSAKLVDSTVVRSNISFFEPVGTDPGSSQDGTFENPYQGLTQVHVNNANRQDNRNFYFNTGKYIQNNVIQFINDNLYGRQTVNGLPFALPAEGNTRPLFDFSHMATSIPDAFQMTTTKDTTVDAIRMLGNDASFGIDMTVNSSRPINVLFSDIDITHFNDGIDVQNTGKVKNLLLTNAVITNNRGFGLELFNQNARLGSFVISHANISENGLDGVFIGNGSGASIGDVTIRKSNFNGNGRDGLQIFNINPNTVMGNVSVSSSDMSNNGNNGMLIDNNSSAQLGNVSLSDVTASNNGLDGIEIDSSNSLMGNVSLSDVTASNNGFAGIEINNFINCITGNVSLSGVMANNNMGNDGVGIFNGLNSIMGNVSLSGVVANNNDSNGVEITNSFALGNISLSGVMANNNGINGDAGLFINNSVGGSIGDLLVSSSDISNNANDGIRILINNTINSITFDTLTAMNNGAVDLYVINSGTITQPGGNTVLVRNSASTLGTRNCTNCTFVFVP